MVHVLIPTILLQTQWRLTPNADHKILLIASQLVCCNEPIHSFLFSCDPGYSVVVTFCSVL